MPDADADSGCRVPDAGCRMPGINTRHAHWARILGTNIGVEGLVHIWIVFKRIFRLGDHFVGFDPFGFRVQGGGNRT